jgi:hypothetical protein
MDPNNKAEIRKAYTRRNAQSICADFLPLLLHKLSKFSRAAIFPINTINPIIGFIF